MNSPLKLFVGVTLYSLLSSSLHAAIILRVEDTGLLQNTPNQVVRILGTYDATLPPIDGVSFNVLIGLGGPDANLGPLPGNVDGPNITSINLKPAGGALSAFTSSQNVTTTFSQFIQADLLRGDTDLPRSTAFTNQLVAQLIVDTTGVPLGLYQVDLQNATLGISSNFLGGVGGNIATTLTSGTLNVTAIPEPGSILMLSLVSILAIQRRRRSKLSPKQINPIVCSLSSQCPCSRKRGQVSLLLKKPAPLGDSQIEF